jgi:uncharacterized protein YhaN
MEPPDAPFRALVSAAAKELEWSTPIVVAVQRQASKVVAALSAGRLQSVALEGGAVAVVGAGGRLRPEALAVGDRDLAWLALRIAVVERLLAAGPAAALVDDALAVVPEPGRPAAARILKALARPGQLLHATAERWYRDAADHLA